METHKLITQSQAILTIMLLTWIYINMKNSKKIIASNGSLLLLYILFFYFGSAFFFANGKPLPLDWRLIFLIIGGMTVFVSVSNSIENKNNIYNVIASWLIAIISFVAFVNDMFSTNVPGLYSVNTWVFFTVYSSFICLYLIYNINNSTNKSLMARLVGG